MKDKSKKRLSLGGIRGFIEDKTALPSDILEGEFSMEIRERRARYMCGCRRIIKYSPFEMIMAAKGFEVRIRGEGLICTSYNCGAITVEGEIAGVDLADWEDGE